MERNELFSNEYFLKIINMLKSKQILIEFNEIDFFHYNSHIIELESIIADGSKIIIRKLEKDFIGILEYVLLSINENLVMERVYSYTNISDLIIEYIFLKYFPNNLLEYIKNIKPQSVGYTKYLKQKYKKYLEEKYLKLFG